MIRYTARGSIHRRVRASTLRHVILAASVHEPKALVDPVLGHVAGGPVRPAGTRRWSGRLEFDGVARRVQIRNVHDERGPVPVVRLCGWVLQQVLQILLDRFEHAFLCEWLGQHAVHPCATVSLTSNNRILLQLLQNLPCSKYPFTSSGRMFDVMAIIGVAGQCWRIYMVADTPSNRGMMMSMKIRSK